MKKVISVLIAMLAVTTATTRAEAPKGDSSPVLLQHTFNKANAPLAKTPADGGTAKATWSSNAAYTADGAILLNPNS